MLSSEAWRGQRAREDALGDPGGVDGVPVAAVARLAAAAPLGPDGAGARADEDAGDEEGARAGPPRLDGAPRSCSFVGEGER